MSKQSEAKQAQGYEQKPVIPVCMNCKNHEEKATGIYSLVRKQCFFEWSEEKEDRCGIGGFAVKKMGTCKLYERKD